VLEELGRRWSLDWGEPIQRGSMSVVIACGDAVLKIGPEPWRIANEAAALRSWDTPHVPAVLAVDDAAGALLLERIEPGTPLELLPDVPALDDVAALLAALSRPPADGYPPLADHVRHLFDSSLRLYELAPALVDLIPRELYERSRAFALRLAADDAPRALLHGDLTPANVLDGGSRGLVAVDPAPCVGDAVFDAVDLVYWGATEIERRAERLGGRRLLDWCVAFAPMAALELAERGDSPVPFTRLFAAVP
jgi:streptomycin 6-kinase